MPTQIYGGGKPPSGSNAPGLGASIGNRGPSSYFNKHGLNNSGANGALPSLSNAGGIAMNNPKPNPLGSYGSFNKQNPLGNAGARGIGGGMGLGQFKYGSGGSGIGGGMGLGRQGMSNIDS